MGGLMWHLERYTTNNPKQMKLEVATELREKGISANYYHADMDANAREKESGRVGRDGLPSECLLYFRPTDAQRQCDVWSAGVIFYILLSGVPPFWDETEQGIFEQVLRGDLDFASEPWPSISDNAKDLVRKMLVRNPKKRLTAHEVLYTEMSYIFFFVADLDNSGTVDYTEFVAAMLHLNKAQKEDHMFAAFTYFDKDGNGYITSDELQHACKQFGLEGGQLEGIMHEVDKDNDWHIDYSEFVAMMQDTGLDK
ncbi:hypothetical protein POM88_026402 [Heracleum sosnowskyi]|uniref:Calcium-dependent protein kinase n=1 Tax=Heracleum sosnowskyi TaxID=360622 RepID=A0AAD8I6F4_9APIA|nr:hypothetical protein POM88_026402 [Heracleum sosnowskyi]